MTDAALLFAEHFVRTRFEDLAGEVVEATKKEILDLLGVAVGGFAQPGGRELLQLVREWGGREESTIIGCSRKVPAPNAAHVNATIAHALDFDDVHETAVMHPGIAVIPVALALGERAGRLSGKELLTSAALGVDLMCRLALATTPGKKPFDTGWHLTSIYGYLGAAATAGRILGLDAEKMVNALGIAYHQSGGTGQAVKDGALTKRLGPGFAVKGWITAALLAERGVTGAKNSLEGEMGLYRVYLRGDYAPEVLTAGLGERFEGPNVAIKPYPCCRGIHPAIDAALELVTEHSVRPEELRRVEIAVSEGHHLLLCTPLEAKLRPRNPVDAQFSIPWGVAVALARKQVTLADFTEEAIRSRDILEVVGKLSVGVDNTLKRPDKIEPTRVRITTNSGAVFSAEVEHPLGSMERPMSFWDCSTKFRDCAKALPPERVEGLIERIAHLEALGDAGELTDLLRFDL
ncbi:MAG: MmgE/PrpD family protein [Deltaproteobacteria bacterium]|nr:MmgE/PrpD family protein [Deltaproteobacteria bacterium]